MMKTTTTMMMMYNNNNNDSTTNNNNNNDNCYIFDISKYWEHLTMVTIHLELLAISVPKKW